MPLGMEVGLGPGDFVLDGDSAAHQEKGHSPQFSAQVYCGQTAGCIRIPLAMEVSLLDPLADLFFLIGWLTHHSGWLTDLNG